MITVSEGTLRTEDLLRNFAEALEALDHGDVYTSLVEEALRIADNEQFLQEEPEVAAWVLAELEDALVDLAPEGTYFGAHPGDGACFGFWPKEDHEPVFDEGNWVEVGGDDPDYGFWTS